MSSKAYLLLALFIATSALDATAMDLKEGYGEFKWNSTCSTNFKGGDWIVEKLYVEFDNAMREVFIRNGEGKSDYTLHRDTNQKIALDDFGTYSTYYGCDKGSGKLKFVLIKFSMMKYKKVKNIFYTQLGDHTKKYGYVRTWQTANIYVQLNQTMALIFYKI